MCHCALCCDPEPLFTSIPHDPCKLGHPLSVMKNVSMVIVSRLLLVPLEVLDPAMMRSCNLLSTPTFVILVQIFSLFPCTKSGLSLVYISSSRNVMAGTCVFMLLRSPCRQCCCSNMASVCHTVFLSMDMILNLFLSIIFGSYIITSGDACITYHYLKNN